MIENVNCVNLYLIFITCTRDNIVYHAHAYYVVNQSFTSFTIFIESSYFYEEDFT